MYDEIIPDSEPEREEQRRHLNEERRVKRTRKRQDAEPTRSMSFVLSSSPEPDLSASFDTFLSMGGLISREGPSLSLSRKISPKQSDARSVISISGKFPKADI